MAVQEATENGELLTTLWGDEPNSLSRTLVSKKLATWHFQPGDQV